MPDSDDESAPPPEPAGRRIPVTPIIAVIAALGAVGLAAWSALRPPPDPDAAPTYSAEQQAEAKVSICTATDLVRQGVSLNTNMQSPGGPEDVTGAMAVAANARVAMSGGGRYLLAKLDPATPNPLAENVTKFANTLMDVGAATIAGALNTDPDQAARLKDLDALDNTLTEDCK